MRIGAQLAEEWIVVTAISVLWNSHGKVLQDLISRTSAQPLTKLLAEAFAEASQCLEAFPGRCVKKTLSDIELSVVHNLIFTVVAFNCAPQIERTVSAGNSSKPFA